MKKVISQSNKRMSNGAPKTVMTVNVFEVTTIANRMKFKKRISTTNHLRWDAKRECYCDKTGGARLWWQGFVGGQDSFTFTRPAPVLADVA